MKIAFLYGRYSIGNRKLDMSSPFCSPAGLTGSEQSCLCYAREMARRGHEVSLGLSGGSECKWEHVTVRPIEALRLTEFDAVCAWNEPDLLRGLHGPLRLVNQQLNDFYKYSTPGFDKWVDVYTSPSNSHKAHVAPQTESPHKFVVLPNGCESNPFPAERVGGRLVYCSSPDRGLHQLLAMWPKIKERIPDAHLRIFYEIKRFLSLAQSSNPDDPFVARARVVKDLLPKCQDVEVIGPVSHLQMQKELASAMALAYPCDPFTYTEGFSVATMDACAAGCIPVITDADALDEIYGVAVPMAKRPKVGEIDQDRYIKLLECAVCDDRFRGAVIFGCRELAAEYSWDKCAKQLEQIIIDASARCRRPTQIARSNPRLFFFNSRSYEPWDHRTPEIVGIGGSETAQVEMTRRMASRGYEVISFSPTPDERQTECGEALWLNFKNADRYLCDDGTWIVSRSPEFLDALPQNPGRQVWFVAQDVEYGDRLNDYRLARIDKLLALCPEHAKYLAARYPSAARKIEISGNGINSQRFLETDLLDLPRNPKRLIWTSSPDRGLRECLDIFERASEQVENLELKIFYGMENIEKACEGDHAKRPWSDCWKQYDRALKMPGVEWCGRVNQIELCKQLFQAAIWLYPSWFSETSCVNCMEAQAAGAIPITNPIWGVGHNVKHGIFIKGSPGDPLVKSRYVAMVECVALNPSGQEQVRREMMPEARARLSWDRVCDQYESWLEDEDLCRPIKPTFEEIAAPCS